MQQVESRRYRVTAVLGEGGFGKVYRAQMMGAEGFVKDVAIKLLHTKDVPTETLQRFRDEARILGLVRDRAVVTVEPPTLLGGRWAVVMEYVDGASAKALLRLGVFPLSVVAEIAQELARALDHVYAMPGPDGEPLQLLHRDIKPENIQISRSGEVKILDFGIAKARFGNREAHTTDHIGGTLGYIAPERLHGLDGPEADVYSTGVMLHFLLEGKRPPREELEGIDSGTLHGQMVGFAARMRAFEPEDRPSWREIEEFCRQVGRAENGVSLRAWAEAAVPKARQLEEDGLVGSVLTETIAGVSLESSITALQGKQRGVNPAMILSLLVIATLVVGLIGTMGGLGVLAASVASRVDAVQPIRRAPPPPVFEIGSVDVPVRIETGPGEEPPTETWVRPVVAPTQAAVTWPITMTSVPAGATVYVDGRRLGTTPLFDVKLTAGSHRVKMVADAETGSTRIMVGKHKPTRYVWKGGKNWRIYSN